LTVLAVGLGAMQVGCGSDSFGGTDQGTLNLVRFASAVEDQPDAVGPTGAQIDVCQNLCQSSGGGGGGGEITFEPFSSTLVSAIVVNEGKSDIVIDRIQVNYPNSGLTDLNTSVAGGLVVPGRRCSNNPTTRCADAFECGGSPCVSQETPVSFTMFDLSRKDLIGGDSCSGGQQPMIIPSFVSIRGADADGERYTVSGGMNLETADFDNCENNQ
jgi:hypothetical protein